MSKIVTLLVSSMILVASLQADPLKALKDILPLKTEESAPKEQKAESKQEPKQEAKAAEPKADLPKVTGFSKLTPFKAKNKGEREILAKAKKLHPKTKFYRGDKVSLINIETKKADYPFKSYKESVNNGASTLHYISILYKKGDKYYVFVDTCAGDTLNDKILVCDDGYSKPRYDDEALYLNWIKTDGDYSWLNRENKPVWMDPSSK